jgi:hypothetical protein
MIETTVEAQCACLLHHGKKVKTSIEGKNDTFFAF